MLFRSDRKSTRLNSSHLVISYAVFCLKKKKTTTTQNTLLAEDVRDDRRPTRKRQRLCCAAVRRSLATLPSVGFTCGVFFFFLNDPATPEFSPFPQPAPLPI